MWPSESFTRSLVVVPSEEVWEGRRVVVWVRNEDWTRFLKRRGNPFQSSSGESKGG
eukprot:CAMPEP_0118648822 /NCGR_PEP_ID=MMETSP0785-20121206/9370_1 /TAXON_ID=91992 /ORGANISM="Bolidomonas pacifica, Strain CCMP 1866" /LENGTH=55 /DNA_ID=CAMNT_0006541059 /DNA_START=95 /DNA_END=262 /DNA_ORIENTATION=+